jgi:hypothetical protein
MIVDESLAFVTVQRKPIDSAAYIGKATLEPTPGARFVEAPSLLLDQQTGQPVAAFGRCLQTPFGLAEMEALKISRRARLADVIKHVMTRTGCLAQNWKRHVTKTDRHAVEICNASFGYIPSRPLFGHMAGPCAFNVDNKDFYLHKLTPAASVMERVYRKFFPAAYEDHAKRSGEILDIYRIGRRSVFTQGVINRSVGFKYHYDKGNFDGVKSAMIVVGEFTGGYLHLPEYDVYVRIQPNTYFIFDGQILVHGVTKIHGRRYSIVYFTVERQTTCGTREEEIKKWEQTQEKKSSKKQKS